MRYDTPLSQSVMRVLLEKKLAGLYTQIEKDKDKAVENNSFTEQLEIAERKALLDKAVDALVEQELTKEGTVLRDSVVDTVLYLARNKGIDDLYKISDIEQIVQAIFTCIVDNAVVSA